MTEIKTMAIAAAAVAAAVVAVVVVEKKQYSKMIMDYSYSCLIIGSVPLLEYDYYYYCYC